MITRPKNCFFFISCFVFRRQTAKFFFFKKKKHQIKAGQNNNLHYIFVFIFIFSSLTESVAMAATTPNINGKPISASTELLAKFKKKWMVKVFGLLVRSTNVLLKFRLTLNQTSSSFDFQLIYLSEEPIDVRITFLEPNQLQEFSPQIRKNMDLFSQKFTVLDVEKLRFKIEVSLISELSPSSFMAKLQNSFNDESTSDCIIQCRGVQFYTHQYILKQRSPHFLGILSQIGETNGKIELEFNDYEPKIVQVMLRYLYNEGICPKDLLGNSPDLIQLMKLADEHFLSGLLDTCDSAYAQFCIFNSQVNPRETFDYFVAAIEATSVPKSAAVFWKWKIGEHWGEISDRRWIRAVKSNPHLAALFAIVGLVNFQAWVIQQEESVLLPLSKVDEKGEFSNIDCDFAFLCGPFGRMRDEVVCQPISYFSDSEMEN